MFTIHKLIEFECQIVWAPLVRYFITMKSSHLNNNLIDLLQSIILRQNKIGGFFVSNE